MPINNHNENPNGSDNAVLKVFLQTMRNERIIKGLTQESIAFDLDISPKAFSKIENGETRLSLVRFLEWCAIMGIHPANFVKEVIDKSNK